MKEIEAEKQHSDAVRDIQKITAESQISLIENVHDREVAKINESVDEYLIKNQKVDGSFELSVNYRIALLNKLATNEEVATRKVVRDISDQTALLRADLDTPTRGTLLSMFDPTKARFQRDLAVETLRQKQQMDKLEREGADPRIIAAQQEQNLLKLQKMNRDEYDKLFDTIAGDAGKVFDDMLSHGKSVFESLGTLFKSIFLTKAREIFSNLVASIFTPLFAKIQGISPGSQTGAGGILGDIKGMLGLGKSANDTINDASKKIGKEVATAMSASGCGCIEKGFERVAQRRHRQHQQAAVC